MRWLPILLTCALLGPVGTAAGQTVVAIPVFNAYLHVDPQDATSPAVPISLSALGLYPGFTIRLEAVGDWDAGPNDDIQTNTLGIFSGSATLLATTLLNRVADAIDAGVDCNTGATWPGNEPCDIPEDFLFNSGGAGVTIVIPADATHLFVSAADIYYRDNSDPDGDYGVRITLIASLDVPAGERVDLAPVSAFPNPFVGGTTIAFRLAQAAGTQLTIYDVAGHRVRALADGFLPAGAHSVRWDGRDDAGTRVAPGAYFARVEGGSVRAHSVRVNLVR